MNKTRIVIVSPALADANNGNGQTARRWQRLLLPGHSARIVREWPGEGAALAQAGAHATVQADEVMLALHARRSAPSIAAWARARGPHGLAVVLTGTDLYRDIATDPQAQHSLALAQRLVVLQDQGLLALPADVRHKTEVVFQSTTLRQHLPASPRHLQVLAVGHLREEKDPLTLMAAARLLPADAGIRITHIGAALDPALAQAALATQAQCPHYRWLGPLPHGATRQRTQRAHVLVHPSRMEGGAHVVMEAVCSGTPVLASRIAGNVGMLGAGYAGYFEPGDAEGLAHLLLRCRAEQVAQAKQAAQAGPVGPPVHPNPVTSPTPLLAQLQAQCAARAPLFTPEHERLSLLRLIESLRKT